MHGDGLLLSSTNTPWQMSYCHFTIFKSTQVRKKSKKEKNNYIEKTGPKGGRKEGRKQASKEVPSRG
jgi:hypothetical protein